MSFAGLNATSDDSRKTSREHSTWIESTLSPSRFEVEPSQVGVSLHVWLYPPHYGKTGPGVRKQVGQVRVGRSCTALCCCLCVFFLPFFRSPFPSFFLFLMGKRERTSAQFRSLIEFEISATVNALKNFRKNCSVGSQESSNQKVTRL